MKNWQKILIPTLISVAIGGIYLLSVWKQRQDPGVIGQNETTQAVSKDDVAVVRELSPQHFDDLKQFENTRVWMKNGYTMPYYPYLAGQVEFGKRAGLIPAAQPLDVKKIVKAGVPPKEDDSLEHGTRQAFAVFALPGNEELFATPIGAMQGDQEAYFADALFFYDDPHTIYDYWPKDVWAAIDAHQVKPGMSELQTRMAIGQKMHPDGDKEGDRTVTYDQDGKNWTVTYVKNRATLIKSE
ncbi:MAG TPA: hypothetical protein VMQ56_14610 [Terracidiphilus sp.]|nr:hypothetical protein [Terracidiphilus sp.]